MRFLLVTIFLAAFTESSPTQIHLAMGKTSETMVVSWSTPDRSDSVVLFGRTRDMKSSAIGNSSSYTTKTVPKNGNDFVMYTSPFIHHVHLTGLEPSAEYYYQIHGASEVNSFVTPPAPGDDRLLTMVMVGDLGQTEDSAATVQHLNEEKQASVMLHAGDMSYADCDGSRWDSYFDMIQPLSKRLPWMVSAGNHEIEPDGTGSIMTPYKQRYAMPQVQPGVDRSRVFQSPANRGYDCTPSAFTGDFDFGNSFYSFDVGLVHVVVLNSYVHCTTESAQYKWLQQDLAGVNKTITPWVIAMFHSPWYNSNHDHQGEFNTIAMREAMEPLFQQYRVSIVLCGHVHAYERSLPVYRNQSTVQGTTYFNIGDGGNREGHSSQWLQSPAWSAAHNGDMFGHSKLTVANKTHALFEWIPNDGYNWIMGDSVWVQNLNH